MEICHIISRILERIKRLIRGCQNFRNFTHRLKHHFSPLITGTCERENFPAGLESWLLKNVGELSRQRLAVQPRVRDFYKLQLNRRKRAEFNFVPSYKVGRILGGQEKRERENGSEGRRVTALLPPRNKVCLEFHYFRWCKSHLCQRGKCGRCAGVKDNPQER